MYGQSSVGEIVKIIGKCAVVSFEVIEISIPLTQLQKVHQYLQATPTPAKQSFPRILNLAPDAHFTFNAEIDLHGMRVSEALSRVDQWVDRGSLLGHKYLKIIHGKGAGILGHAVRTYLQSHSQVKRVIDKHPYLGGQGVTWVELD